MSTPALRCTAFAGTHRIASGELRHVALKAKQVFDSDPGQPILVFEDATGAVIELPLELPAADLLRTLNVAPQDPDQQASVPATPRGPGRPRLGVVAREITLLPCHWDWLGAQPGGASVALRRLVEDARRISADGDRMRLAQEATYRFLHALAGNLPGYEDATRALFAGNFTRFEEALARWPEDVREHASFLAADAFVH
ncbi:MAG: DUF2239 family protein [Pseudomonadota bacterium]|nr:DUF2239 family protein [Pseudomonadota bacterium]MDQ3160679.1 DUF2239 family protein [Pseudomonadota bacterium]